MKMRRPERFSDTVIAKKGNLNRSILEYKLEVLTSNSQEHEFQNFCFKLSQLEIAPNLRPQTGPSGGGDSLLTYIQLVYVSHVYLCCFLASRSRKRHQW